MTPYRSFALLCVAICALTSACAADRGSQATTEPVEFSQDAGRHLLQGRGGTGSGAGVGSGSGTPSGQRLFSEVAAHKQPNTPKLTRKTFERQVPSGRHLLQGRGGTGSGAGVGSGSGTPSGQRLFSEVAAHKQPNTPKLTRKTFERQVPSGRHLLQGRGGTGSGAGVGSGSGTPSGQRLFSEVAAHKQPNTPKLTRKTFERQAPSGRHLLQGRGGTGSGAGVGSGSGTPSGQRLFSEVAAHKQPNTPKLTRKTFERQVPSGRHLLQGRGGTGSGAGVGSGSGTPSGQRLFSEVAAHKQPNTPKLTRKTFERQVPSGRHLLQGRGGTGSGAGVGSGSGTPSGQRLFSEVAAHKQPNTPKLTRKTFERQVPSGRKAV